MQCASKQLKYCKSALSVLSIRTTAVKATHLKLVFLNPKRQRTKISNAINIYDCKIVIAEKASLNMGHSFCAMSKWDDVQLCQITRIFFFRFHYLEESYSTNIQFITLHINQLCGLRCLVAIYASMRFLIMYEEVWTLLSSLRRYDGAQSKHIIKESSQQSNDWQRDCILEGRKSGTVTLLSKEDCKEEILTQLNINECCMKLDYYPTTVYIQ